MALKTISLRLPDGMLQAAMQLAGRRDVSLGQVIREAVNSELRRAARAKTSESMDERLLAPLRALLAEDLGHASTWQDLDKRLRSRGYVLAEAGGGLVLRSWPEGRRICKASELGYSHNTLARRFGAGFPGHAHGARRPASPLTAMPRAAHLR